MSPFGYATLLLWPTRRQEGGGEDPHINAHEVRALAHSLAHYRGASLKEVLDGGRWRGGESFFRHYLRDMTGSLEGPAGTAPVVIAGRTSKD